jgi:hypothetical protein
MTWDLEMLAEIESPNRWSHARRQAELEWGRIWEPFVPKRKTIIVEKKGRRRGSAPSFIAAPWKGARYVSPQTAYC